MLLVLDHFLERCLFPKKTNEALLEVGLVLGSLDPDSYK